MWAELAEQVLLLQVGTYLNHMVYLVLLQADGLLEAVEVEVMLRTETALAEMAVAIEQVPAAQAEEFF